MQLNHRRNPGLCSKSIYLKWGWFIVLPKHITNTSLECFKPKNLNVLNRLYQSPELNPVENLWKDLKNCCSPTESIQSDKAGAILPRQMGTDIRNQMCKDDRHISQKACSCNCSQVLAQRDEYLCIQQMSATNFCLIKCGNQNKMGKRSLGRIHCTYTLYTVLKMA